MACGGVLMRDPILSWISIVRHTVKNKFPGFWDFYRKIDDFRARH